MLPFRRFTPIGSSCDSASIGAEANGIDFSPVTLAHELTDVPFAAPAHLRGARIAQMRVVRPDHDLARAFIEVIGQSLQSFGHVLIAQVPRIFAPTKHRSIVTLGIGDEPRVLFGIKEFVARELAVATDDVAIFAAKIDELSDDFFLARFRLTARRRVTVGLRILAEEIETAVTLPRPLSGVRINFVEIMQNGFDGRMETVKIHSENAGAI